MKINSVICNPLLSHISLHLEQRKLFDFNAILPFLAFKKYFGAFQAAFLCHHVVNFSFSKHDIFLIYLFFIIEMCCIQIFLMF